MSRQIVFDVEVDSGNSPKTLKGLREELESINEELENVEVGSKRFQELSKEAAKTSSGIKDIEKSFEGLDAVQRSESFAKAFEGIAGAVAVTAGSLQLFGVESDRIGKLEEKVQGAIAIAIGARSVAEGALQARIAARVVAEKASAVATKALTVVQRVYNAVLNANPIFLLVTVIAAVVTGIYALSKAMKSNTKDIQENTDALIKQNENYAKGQEFSLRLARARGESAIELKKREQELNDTLLEGAKLRLKEAKNEEDREKAKEEYSKAIQNRILLRTELRKLESDEEARIEKEAKERREKALEERRKQREQEYKEFKDFYRGVAQVRNQIIEENAELLGKTLTKQITDANDAMMKDFDNRIKQTTAMAQKAQEDSSRQSISNLQAYAELASYAVESFVESNAFQTTKELATTANSFISDLQGGLDESNEEGFEKAKKYKIAQVITTGTQAAFEAFAGAQKYNAVVPGLGTAIGIALVGAIAAKSKKSIADIRSAEFGGGGGTPSAGGGGGGSTLPSVGGGFTPIGQQAANTQLTPDFNAPVAPVRAYVIGQDVEDSREAEARLNRRRTLGPG